MRRTLTPPSRPRLSPTELTVAWQAASLLIGYPDEQLLARLPLLRRATAALPEPVAAPLGSVVDHLDATPAQLLAADYVATFDHQRRCCLFLTYFAHGDTRKRGLALLRFKQTYAEAGLVLHDDELPDHLSVVLEFGATTDQATARRLLLEHRAGLELLRISLRDCSSPWAGVLEAVCVTLPPLGGEEAEAVRRLVEQGPPEEEVGLEPFAPPEYMPAPLGAPGSVTPTVRTPVPVGVPTLRTGAR